MKPRMEAQVIAVNPLALATGLGDVVIVVAMSGDDFAAMCAALQVVVEHPHSTADIKNVLVPLLDDLELQ